MYESNGWKISTFIPVTSDLIWAKDGITGILFSNSSKYYYSDTFDEEDFEWQELVFPEF